MVLETKRLILRDWKDSDLEPFAELNANPDVMAYFPSVLSKSESDHLALTIRNKIESEGWGPWAVELKTTQQFIGVVGLQRVDVNLPVAPGVEIAWRLAKSHWGRGYATEAAKASLEYATDVLKVDQVISFTATLNTRSQAVMKKIGMQTDGTEFDHPSIPSEHPLCRHVLYTINLGSR